MLLFRRASNADLGYPGYDAEVVIKRKALQALNLEKDFLMYVFREGRKVRGIDFNSIYNYLKHL